MAIWQFKFSLVPAEHLQSTYQAGVTVLQGYRTSPGGPKVLEEVEVQNYWDNPSSLRQVALASSGLLPEIASWSEDARMFGDAESDKIEVWDNDVNCFVDMRYFSEKFVGNILSIANKFNCKIVVHGSGVVIDPVMAQIMEQIVISHAYSFCVSPSEYLQGL